MKCTNQTALLFAIHLLDIACGRNGIYFSHQKNRVIINIIQGKLKAKWVNSAYFVGFYLVSKIPLINTTCWSAGHTRPAWWFMASSLPMPSKCEQG